MALIQRFLSLVLLATLAAPTCGVGRAAEPIQLPPEGPHHSQTQFPDPLLMSDGRGVTTREQWFEERRPELVALFQEYMYGFLPPAPGNTTGKVEREDRTAFGGRATLKEVTVRFGPPQLRPIHLMLVIPKDRQGPAPVILGMNYFGNHTLVRDRAVMLSTNWMPERGEGVVNNRSTEASRGSWVIIWQIEKTIARGYAVATFYNGDIDPDRPDERGIQTYYRQQDPKYDCGTIAAWAWGLQRAVDYLVTDADLDQRRIVVTGHSRLGKAALLAAALDERIALAITLPAFGEIERSRLLAVDDLFAVVTDKFHISPGHTLIIARRPVARFQDLTAAEKARLLVWIDWTQEHLTTSLSPAPDAFNLGLNDGPAAGQTMPQLHFHVIPRYTDDVPDPRGGIRHIIPSKALYW